MVDTLVIVPADPPAAGPDRALAAPPDPGPPSGLLLAAAEAGVRTEAAAAPAAMTGLRVLENICLTPIVEILDLRYRRPRWKFGGRNPEGNRKVVQHELKPRDSQKVGKVTPRSPGSRAGCRKGRVRRLIPAAARVPLSDGSAEAIQPSSLLAVIRTAG